jgi:quercetin dioxygenase-like cupin family protein
LGDESRWNGEARCAAQTWRTTMRTKFLLSATAIVAAICASAAMSAEEHGIILPPEEIKWGPGPASIPAGSEAVVLYGDPSKEGLFALRLKLPKDYAIAPHSHPKPEVVTVISGTFGLGMGETGDQSKARALPAGSFFAMEPNTTHYAVAKEDTVIQLNSTGPWTLTYVNPADDPRQKSQ